MRAKFVELVEGSRLTTGHRGTTPGVTWGFFFLKHPRTGRRFKVMVGDGLGWDHVSVSLEKRTPTWDEMCWIKNLFFEPTECVIQYHPAVEDYVDIHGNCLHLWRPQEETIPMPPEICV